MSAVRRTLAFLAVLTTALVPTAPAAAQLTLGEPELLLEPCTEACFGRFGSFTIHDDRLFFTVTSFSQGVPVGVYAVEPGGGLPDRLADGHYEYLDTVGGRLVALHEPARLEALQPDDHLTLLVDRFEDDGLIWWPMVEANGNLFFAVDAKDPELWATDGTEGGTRRLGVFPDGCPAFPSDHRLVPDLLAAAGDSLYFVVYAEGQGCTTAIWKTDGTAGGTVEVTTAGLGPSDDLIALGDRIIFSKSSELWVSDGTAPGTRSLGSFGRSIRLLRPQSGGLAYFVASEDLERKSLGRTDGTRDGTFELAEDVLEVTVSEDGRAFFTRGRSEAQAELWVTDGTIAGTRVAGDLRPGAEPSRLRALAGRVLFDADDGVHGREPWVSDGTPEGTRLLRDVLPGPDGSRSGLINPPDGGFYNSRFETVGNLALFLADDGVHGAEPWVSDGTPEGTLPVGDLDPGPAWSDFEIGDLGARFDGYLYLAIDQDDPQDTEGPQLWRVAVASQGDPNRPPAPPADATMIGAPELDGFRLWVRIAGGGTTLPVRRESACIPETVCISGAVPGRSELFVRIVGPKPNGNLWPTLVRFSTSEIEVWIEQVATGVVRHYKLEGASPGSSELDGLFDRDGFEP